jgi:excisionase family DNA binding protein
METNTTLSDLEPLIGVEELAEYLDVPVKTLYEWHQAGRGPCAVRVGRRLRYLVSDVHSWLVTQRTADPEQHAGGR